MSKDRKKRAFNDMMQALEEKEEARSAAKEREKLDNIAHKKYIESLEQREYEFKLKRAELEEIKNQIFEKMKLEQE